MSPTPSIRIGFALGSNLGDRGQSIHQAFSFLESCGSDLLRSSIYESDPIDCPPESPTFLNAAGELSYSGELIDLLDACQEFERALGRPEIRSKNSPRPVDIDLLYAEGKVVHEARLTLPHPAIASRAFVLQPLMDICPDRVIDGLGASVSDLWQKLLQRGENQVCRKIA